MTRAAWAAGFRGRPSQRARPVFVPPALVHSGARCDSVRPGWVIKKARVVRGSKTDPSHFFIVFFFFLTFLLSLQHSSKNVTVITKNTWKYRKTLMLLCWPTQCSSRCSFSICLRRLHALFNTFHFLKSSLTIDFSQSPVLGVTPCRSSRLLAAVAKCLSLSRVLEISPWTFQKFCFPPLKLSLTRQTI